MQYTFWDTRAPNSPSYTKVINNVRLYIEV